MSASTATTKKLIAKAAAATPATTTAPKQPVKRAAAGDAAPKKSAPAKQQQHEEVAPVQPEYVEAKFEGEIKTPKYPDNDYRSIPISDIIVVPDSKKGDKGVTVKRRIRDAKTGQYLPVKEKSGTKYLAVAVPPMLMSPTSRVCGEGDFGVKQKYPTSRASCAYTIGLFAADLKDHVLYPGLEEEQLGFFKWLDDVCVEILRQLFLLQLPSWGPPIAKAMDNARNALYKEYGCAKKSGLETKEAQDPAIKQAVFEKALEEFIEHGKLPIPDAEQLAESGKRPSIWPKFKVWKFQEGKYDPTKHRGEECPKGPTVIELPSKAENWKKIVDQMTNDVNLRVYTPMKYFSAGGARGENTRLTPEQIDYDWYTVKDADGNVVTEPVKDKNGAAMLDPVTKQPLTRPLQKPIRVDDPFWNPCLYGNKNPKRPNDPRKPRESLVRVNIYFDLNRGDSEEDAKYGVKLGFQNEITIVKHQARTESNGLGVDAEAVDVGYKEDTFDDDEPELAPPVVASAAGPVPADVDAQPEEPAPEQEKKRAKKDDSEEEQEAEEEGEIQPAQPLDMLTDNEEEQKAEESEEEEE